MADNATDFQAAPQLETVQQADGQFFARLSGSWHVCGLVATPKLHILLKQSAENASTHWDLSTVTVLDSAAALIIWQAWGGQWPTEVLIKPEHRLLLQRWQDQVLPNPPPKTKLWDGIGQGITDNVGSIADHLRSLLIMQGQLLLDAAYLLSHRKVIPWAEISIIIYDAGVRALGITALVGFLIGIVLSYLSALQLKMFGAEVFIINILGMSIIRELGPLLAAILVAGRSGSAMTAQIGIMRVTEELDALSAMGIAHSMRLVLPKIVALSVVMPLLNEWTNAAALLGGMVSALLTLDIGMGQFFMKLPEVVPLVNVFIGLAKSAVFGFAIALLACHFGFRIKPNTESLGIETTNSVVASITAVIIIDAVFAILLMNVGVPQ